MLPGVTVSVAPLTVYIPVVVSGLALQVAPPSVDSYQLYDAAPVAVTVKVAVLVAATVASAGLAEMAGATTPVPVADTQAALLQPLLLLMRAYSVIGVPAVTALVLVTAPEPPAPVPSLLLVPLVDHSIVEPAPGSLTLNTTLPLPHIVWLLKPLADEGRALMVIVIGVADAVEAVTQVAVEVMVHLTTSPLASALLLKLAPLVVVPLLTCHW